MRRHVGNLKKPEHSAMRRHAAPVLQRSPQLGKNDLIWLSSSVKSKTQCHAYPAFGVLSLHVYKVEDYSNVVTHVQIIIHSCLIPANCGK